MSATVFRGGEIVTCDAKDRTVEALGIKGGRIVAAGAEDDVRYATGPGAKVVDLGGATMLPGIVDTHPHVMHFGAIAEACVDLSDALDHADIVNRIAQRAKTTSAGDWVMATPVGEAHYFIRRSYRDLKEGALPDRHVLDRATADHPVFVQAWAPVTPNVLAFNSRALKQLGIDRSTPDRVSNVWIEKDATGEPTGRLTGSVTNYYSNDPFMTKLLKEIPLLNPEVVIPGTIRAMRAFNAMGVTTIYEGHAMDFPLIDAYRFLRQSGHLSMRVLCCPEIEPYGMPWTAPLDDAEFAARLVLARDMVSRHDDLLRVDGLTIGRGGPCWPGLLLMREPYRGPYGEETTGVSFVSLERVQRAIDFCSEHGVRLNVVTAGTAEHDDYLERFEALSKKPLTAEGRAWILQHIFFVEEEQARRIGALGLDATTSVSFSWGKGELFRERIGEEVLKDLMPLKRLLNHGIKVGCGTDWGPRNVFEQIALAVEPRFAGSGAKNAGPAQVVSRREALRMWTRDAAQILRWNGIGSLEAGNHADLAIVDRNPLSAPLETLPETKVHATLLAGNAVHGAEYLDR